TIGDELAESVGPDTSNEQFLAAHEARKLEVETVFDQLSESANKTVAAELQMLTKRLDDLGGSVLAQALRKRCEDFEAESNAGNEAATTEGIGITTGGRASDLFKRIESVSNIARNI